MPFCPKCKAEYREGFTTCSDCKVPLVDTLSNPPEPSYSKEPLVCIYEAPDEIRSELVKEALERAGLPVTEQLGVAPSIYDGMFLSVTGYYSRLLTLESQAEAAKRLVADFLAAYERGDLTLPDSP